MKEFSVKLSQAQAALFCDALIAAEKLGDCCTNHSVTNPSVRFDDYEGVHATLVRLADVPTPTAAQMRSWVAFRDKVHKGVRETAK